MSTACAQHRWERDHDLSTFEVRRWRCAACTALGWSTPFSGRVRAYSDPVRALARARTDVAKTRRALSMDRIPMAGRGYGPNGAEPRDPNEN